MEIYRLLACVDFMAVIMGDTHVERRGDLNLTILTLCVYPLTKGRTKSL